MPGIIPYKSAKEQYPYRVTAKLRGAFAMGDQPSELLGGWLGYFHQQDPTTFVKDNVLTYPSVNCFIPFRDKIVPRLGTELLGVPFTMSQNWPIVGHMKKYGTMGGYELELRVVKSNGAKADIIEAYCPDFLLGVPQTTFTWKQVTLNTNPIPVGKHEYYFDQWFDTDLDPAQALNLSRAIWVNGTTNIYSWSGGMAPIVSTTGSSITTVAGRSWASYGFIDPAYDSTVPAIINVNGISYMVYSGWETDTLQVPGTSGVSINDIAFSPIQTNKTPVDISASITHNAVAGGPFKNGELVIGVTSGAVGFMTSDGAGPGPMIIYGSQAGPTSGLFFQPGESIRGVSSLASTTVTTYTVISNNQVVFDVCRNNNGYMYYGCWDLMKVFQSNQFAKDANTAITNVQAIQNDLVIGTTDYTGTGQHVYRVSIDSVAVDDVFFNSTGPNGINDATFITTNYNGVVGVTNIYKVLVVADFTLVYTGSGGFTPGELVTAGTAPNFTATGRIVAEAIANPGGTNLKDGIVLLSGNFIIGDTITGQSSGVTETLIDVHFQNWVQYFKNNVPIVLSYSIWNQLTLPIDIGIALGVLNLTDNLQIQFGNDFNHQVGDNWILTKSNKSYDTFKWQLDGAAPIVGASLVAITANPLIPQLLSNGVTITFISKNGHTLGDYWDITATQGVGGVAPTDSNQQAYANFYYTLPNRIPGEGFIYTLTANFWAMSPQESYMYVCNNYGAWSYISTVTKASTVSGTFEEISIIPLKQVSASKPVYPYMIGYLDNDLIFVTTDKTLDMIGRKELIQLPRIDNMSHPVQLDFDVTSFKGGSMEYWHKKLFINSPKEGVMFCYDNHPENKYWQPPQIIPENGLLSIFNKNGTDYLISHSPIRDQSWTLFSGQNGDNGGEYLVQARTPYLAKGNRWGSKSANKTFSEGYVTGNPPMVQTLLKEVNGCGGIIAHNIKPVVCVANTTAPFGKGHFGSHPNGSDLFSQNNYFKEVYPYQQTQNYYFAAIQMSCLTTNHSYEWLTFGINSVIGSTSNIDFMNQQVISPI